MHRSPGRIVMTVVFSALALNALLLIALHPLLDLEPEARGGLWTGAAVMLAFGVWAAWYLRRVIDRDSAAVSV